MLSRKLVYLVSLGASVLSAAEPVDLDMVTRIRQEGLDRSQVMETLFHLSERIGPRLTGSPQMKAANDWTRDKLAGWGLANARLEGFPFGAGWSCSRHDARVVAPREIQLLAVPEAWTAGTGEPRRGQALRVDLQSEADFERYKGQLAGKILLLEPPRDDPADEAPAFLRYTDERLSEIEQFGISTGPGIEQFQAVVGAAWRFRRARNDFLAAEGALATLSLSSRDHGILRVAAEGELTPQDPQLRSKVPGFFLGREHYNHIARRVASGKTVELEVQSDCRFHEADTNAYNTLAEIPGTSGEIVMAGAHLDSWQVGTGATDNAAGVAIVMEAVRILKALDVKPRRTIRVALWAGEEQGLHGSLAYVQQHLARFVEGRTPEEKALPPWARPDTWPRDLKPEHGKLSVYFNLDSGAGRIRGLHSAGNAAAVPILRAWLEPFADLGATAIVPSVGGGSDQFAFDLAGIPAFHLLQDELDYMPHTHHSTLDTYDHVLPPDLKQASVVLASLLYHAAMRPERLPRKPLRTEPE